MASALIPRRHGRLAPIISQASHHDSSSYYDTDDDDTFSISSDDYEYGDGITSKYYAPLTRQPPRDLPHQDLPPSILLHPSTSTSSVGTYDSALSDSESEPDMDLVDDDDDDEHDFENQSRFTEPSTPPASLPAYRRAAVSEASSVESSDPDSFARLFPSMDRLHIHHDDRTPDGNMNLRIDTIAAYSPAPPSKTSSNHRRQHHPRPVTVQLFHLRMHDLARREFSLRRYSRDSGREVCNSKGADPSTESSSSSPFSSPFSFPSSSSIASSARPAFQRGVSTAIQSFKTSFRRSGTAAGSSGASTKSQRSRRPSIVSNSSWAAGSAHSIDNNKNDDKNDDAEASKPESVPGRRPIPANVLKLEFSNYAHVDVTRQGSKRYEFSWWGHQYAWKRVVDKTLGTVAFHLVRDGRDTTPVAHIVPEGQSPNQVDEERFANGWVPPCYMWISDPTIVDAVTDVAEYVFPAPRLYHTQFSPINHLLTAFFF